MNRQSLHSELVNRLKAGMARTGMTQVELSQRTGVPQGNISRILREQRPGTSLDTWDRLLHEVGMR